MQQKFTVSVLGVFVALCFAGGAHAEDAPTSLDTPTAETASGAEKDPAASRKAASKYFTKKKKGKKGKRKKKKRSTL